MEDLFRPTRLDRIAALLLPRRLVEQLFECFGMREERFFQYLEILKAALANSDELSVERPEGVQGIRC
jgi:hypothetical protein